MSENKISDLSFVSLFLCCLVIVLAQSEKKNFAIPVLPSELKKQIKFLARNRFLVKPNFKVILPNRAVYRRNFSYLGAYFGNVPRPILVYHHE